jgi:small subunit ribosomal protein S8
MGMTDPIADMLTRVRNAIMSRHESVDIPYSNIKFEILKILKEEGYLKNYKTFVDETRKKYLKAYINYDENGSAVISGLKRISKPGRRLYMKVDETMKKRNRLSTVILSTSKGIMLDRNAKKSGVGGEPLVMVW